jgi:hypothetical protein
MFSVRVRVKLLDKYMNKSVINQRPHYTYINALVSR